MARSFRRLPPEPRPGTLVRSRPLGRLAGRWGHPVTAVVGGPGRGKTTLLAQAVSAAGPPGAGGDHVWLGLDPADADADRLAGAVADALADHGRRPETQLVAGDVTPRPAAVAAAMWQRAPRHVCLVLDDAHLLTPGSTGERWLVDLVAALPANGHVLLATATEPPPDLPVGLRLDDADLALDPDEAAELAATPGVDSVALAARHGDPAGGVDEVVRGLAADLRPAVEVLADLGGADVDLLVAALGPGATPVAADADRDPPPDPDDLRAVPLVAADGAGWYVAHELLAAALGPPDDRDAVRDRAVDHLVGRGRYDDAFLLAADAERWDLVPGVLRAAALVAETLPANQLGRWLAACPVAVHDSPAGRLATGLHLAYTAPFDAIEPLRRAAADYRAAGDADAELVAISHIGRLAWWWQDVDLIQDQTRRVFALEQEGHLRAGALAAFAWAVVADMGGDDEAVLAHLGRIPAGALDPGWELLARWYEGLVRLYLGQPAATRIIVDSLVTADPSLGYVVETLELMALWATGHVDAVMERTPAVADAARAYGVTYSLSLGLTTASLAYSHTGDPAAARRCLDDALAAAPPPAPVGDDVDVDLEADDGGRGRGTGTDDERRSVHAALAVASLRLAEGDEAAAVAALERAEADHGVDRGPERRWWRQSLALSYVLVPEARAVWDGRELRGHLATARSLAAALVALRSAGDPAALRGVDLPHLGVARSALHLRFAAELAVGLAGLGRAEGRHLLDALGAPGRAVVRSLATDPPTGWGPAMARAAHGLLAAVPSPPREPTDLAVLGQLTLRRGGADAGPVTHPAARGLLAFLVTHRRTTRAAVERAIGRDLGAALDHLLAALEPTRTPGEAAYLLRLEGDAVELVTGDHLRIDVDAFDAHVAAAARAESVGAPADALAHHRAVAALHRGPLHADLPTEPAGEWLPRERDRYRSRFVASAVRAAQLLQARGGPDDLAEATVLAERALAADPGSIPARDVLAAAP